MEIRQVKLNGGPADGVTSMASHDTAIHDGEVYVWDGGDDKNQFTHALTAVNKLPYPQRVWEARKVDEWMKHPGSPSGIKGKDGKDLMIPAPMAMCIGIAPWRINAWMQLLKLGLVA